jgi:Zn-finger nucleic acid-binding protein
MSGGGPFRGDPSTPGSPGHCPRCPDVELEPRAHGSVELAFCRSCRGSWVGKGRLLDLLLAADKDLVGLSRHEQLHSRDPPPRAREVLAVDDSDVLAPLACPCCFIEMQRQETASGVAVDVCPRHGLWFDTAELEPFLAYILSMG